MPSNSYYEWVAAGKPLTPALPVRQTVEQLKVAFPKAAQQNLFSWYANDAHYKAVPPQDHTPFSATGWPGTSPRWYVFATDIMDRSDLGVDCDVLFTYWIGEARAGRMPWMKYFIWQAKIYDVRNGWRPTAGSDHFDHVHMSTRTDYINSGLGSWSIAPGGDGSMLIQVKETLAVWTVDAVRTWRRSISSPQELASWKGAPVTPVPQAEVNSGWWGTDVAMAVKPASGPGGLVPHTHGLAAGETNEAVASNQ